MRLNILALAICCNATLEDLFRSDDIFAAKRKWLHELVDSLWFPGDPIPELPVFGLPDFLSEDPVKRETNSYDWRRRLFWPFRPSASAYRRESVRITHDPDHTVEKYADEGRTVRSGFQSMEGKPQALGRPPARTNQDRMPPALYYSSAHKDSPSSPERTNQDRMPPALYYSSAPPSSPERSEQAKPSIPPSAYYQRAPQSEEVSTADELKSLWIVWCLPDVAPGDSVDAGLALMREAQRQELGINCAKIEKQLDDMGYN